MFLLPWAGLEHSNKNTAFRGSGRTPGPESGPVSERSHPVATFTAHLRASGFASEQLQTIAQAMVAAGLLLVESERAGL